MGQVIIIRAASQTLLLSPLALVHNSLLPWACVVYL